MKKIYIAGKINGLKKYREVFKEVVNGNKTFEIRKNDRDFKVGDTLLLQEYKKGGNIIDDLEFDLGYTGQEITKEVSYILYESPCGLKEGYCILGLKQEGIILKNINLSIISREEQAKKVNEEMKEFFEAFAEYISNRTDKNKKHVIEEFWDENQSKLGLLEKYGITAKEVMEGYPLHEKKLKNRPRIKKCSKCINRSLTTFGAVKAYQCDKNDEMIYSDDYAKQCKDYKEQEE